MGLSIQPSIPGSLPSRTSGPGPAGAVPGTATSSAGAGLFQPPSGADQADLSPVAVLLAQLRSGDASPAAPLPAPGSPPARALEGLVARQLGTLLRAAALPAGPALEFTVEPDGRVHVQPGRPDAPAVQRLVDAEPDLQALVRLLDAIQGQPIGAMATAGPASRETLVPAAPRSPTALPWPWAGPTQPRPPLTRGRWPVRIAGLLLALALLTLFMLRG